MVTHSERTPFAARVSAALAWLTVAVAVGHLVIALPLYALLIWAFRAWDEKLGILVMAIAFLGWVAAGVLGWLARREQRQRPRLAATLLLLATPGLIFPVVFPALVPLVASALGFLITPQGTIPAGDDSQYEREFPDPRITA